MQIRQLLGMLCLAALVWTWSSGSACAQEADVRRRQVEMLLKQAQQLEDQGRIDQARQAREQAERLAQSLRHWQAQRIEHLHRAAESLKAGGFSEEAQQLQHRAEQMERELHPAPAPAAPEVLLAEIRELRQCVEGLRQEIAQLRRQMERMHTGRERPVSGPGETLPAQDVRRAQDVPDEALDAPIQGQYDPAPPRGRATAQPTPAARPPRKGPVEVELEYQLVPVPPGDHGPVPTPATPDRP